MKNSVYVSFVVISALLAGCATTKSGAEDSGAQMTLEERIQHLEARVAALEFEQSALQEAMARDGVYIIKAGDTGLKIANRFGLTLAELAALNPEIEWKRLRVGMRIKVKNAGTNEGTSPTPMSVASPTGQAASEP